MYRNLHTHTHLHKVHWYFGHCPRGTVQLTYCGLEKLGEKSPFCEQIAHGPWPPTSVFVKQATHSSNGSEETILHISLLIMLKQSALL